MTTYVALYRVSASRIDDDGSVEVSYKGEVRDLGEATPTNLPIIKAALGRLLEILLPRLDTSYMTYMLCLFQNTRNPTSRASSINSRRHSTTYSRPNLTQKDNKVRFSNA